MAQLPLFLNSEKLQCLLVGGGQVAARKLDTLISHAVPCRIVAKSVGERTQELAEQHGIAMEVREFRESDLDGVNFVISATNDSATNRDIASLCAALSILVNVVDDYELSTATFPAIINREPVIVAVSTDGHSPTLARRLKSKLDGQLSEGLGRVATFLARKRRQLGTSSSRRIWDDVLDSNIPDLLERGNESAAERLFEQIQMQSASKVGFVSLVGAGPGDPSLLTLKAVRCMERADVVFYDNLVSPDVLARVRKDAEKVYVGKKRRFAGIRQEGINRLLLEGAKAGKHIVRLKGGDPFMFGRGGEEIETLAKEGIEFEVVPGITAALGCSAYAGIPLTHRDYAQSVRFVTGHLKSDEIHLDWPELAKPEQTLVVYMGLANLALFTENLIKNGMPSDQAIAVISRGTFPDQKVIKSTLTDVQEELAKHDLVSPTTAIIGGVVAFAEKLESQ